MEGSPGEDGVDLQESAGGWVAERGFEIPEVEAFCGHGGLHLRHEGFAFVERQGRHFQLEGEGVVEKLGASGEHLGFVALNVELEEDATVGGGRWDDVIEAAEGDYF